MKNIAEPSAAAITFPGCAMGVSWAMLSSWGVSTAEYVLYTLVSAPPDGCPASATRPPP